ncbi:MAG: hypothetical protein IKL55_00845 [Clostridia bacterium]|nr:hypothetical protein [Clostridia bacterium]
MEENFKEAFYEVDVIIKLLPKELLEKIPTNLKQLIKENKSTTYKRNNIKLENIKDLKKETRIILYHIYRDFLISDEERTKIKQEEKEIIEEKYSYDKLFIQKQIQDNKQDDEKEQTNALIKLEKNKWYIKIINFFKSKF